MNIFDYFMNASASSIRANIIKGGWFSSFHDMPKDNESFCERFGLEDDERIHYYATESGLGSSKHMAVCIWVASELPEPIGKFDYEFEFCVKGYKTPTVSLANCGGNRGIHFDFGSKYYRPFAPQKDNYNLIFVDWKNEHFMNRRLPEIGQRFIPNTLTVGKVMDVIQIEAAILNPIFKSIIECFESGEFKKIFTDTKKKPDNLFPALWSLTNLIYNAKMETGINLTPEEATLLSLYYLDVHGKIGHVATDNAPKDQRLQTIWNWSMFDNLDQCTATADDIRALIGEARGALGASSDEFEEFTTKRVAADDYVIERLKEAVEEASVKFGIKPEFIYLNKMSDKNIWLWPFDGDKAPKDWRR